MANKKTWLDGPTIPGENDFDAPGRWPGEKLGLPERGPGALAPVSRRAGAVAIDWLLAYAIAILITQVTHVFGGPALVMYVVWALIGIIGGWLFARTPGMALRGIGVARLDVPGERVGLWRAVARTLLTAFIFPAAMVDMDGRGMHDRGTGTVVIYS
ncbi:RDD family protein [Corynebacterium lizhenjunii]|uniref:RDD family protein n=1 Tax=Corynebacterium lizhenjunii TaxID=2709394 RepID=A0A7T0KD34_9CORY|nr:RDD family protein [Corynebacterium lizhenjunii]QPK78545.1 RDD family protein [Corynebacterium lizhenjunii]